MSATEETRALLDEHGVEYRTHGTTDRTWFEVGNISWFIIERENGNLTADAVFLTPEQAVEATVGRGTCHMERDFRRWDDDLGWLTSYTCLACGESVILMSNRKPSCCPNCNRKVVDG